MVAAHAKQNVVGRVCCGRLFAGAGREVGVGGVDEQVLSGRGGDSPPQYMVRQGKEMTLIIQILMIEQKHWLGLLRLLWKILWGNSSLSTLLFIQSCKLYFGNEACLY